MEEVSDVVLPGPGRSVRVFAWSTLVIIVGAMVAVIVAFFLRGDDPLGDPGRLSEEPIERPTGLVGPDLVDVTLPWGLGEWETSGLDPRRGGATLHDLDGDGDLDLVVAGGILGLYEWVGDGFEERRVLDVGDAISVFAGDVDRDGMVDLLVGATNGATIIWGGSFFDEESESVDLGVDGLVTGVVPVDLSTGSPEVLVLGYGGVSPTSDLLLSMTGRLIEQTTVLPNSERKSMVAQVADVDDDGLADIWVGRDLGWATGGDSVYSRQGDPGGAWVDIAGQVGVDLEIDAMGLTLADLTGDGRLDAYLSDLGDNELLVANTAGFEPLADVGLARIRSAGAGDNEISRSWASGAADLNLDGHIDLVVANGGFAEISVQNKVVNTFILGDDPPALFLGLGDGTFYDVWPELGLAWTGRSRGMSLGDIDGDGDTDIVIVDHGGGIHALRNDLQVEGTGSTHAGCLAGGATVRYGDDGGVLLWHQQSFLGAHAPEYRAPVDLDVTVSAEPCD